MRRPLAIPVLAAAPLPFLPVGEAGARQVDKPPTNRGHVTALPMSLFR